MTSSQSDLTGRLRQKLETERLEIEQDGHARAAEAWQELERCRKLRASFNRRRYGGVDRTDARSPDARLGSGPW